MSIIEAHNNSSRRGTSFWLAETFCECRASTESTKFQRNFEERCIAKRRTELSQKVLVREDLR